MALASITWADVLLVAPELTTVSTEVRADILAYVDAEVASDALGVAAGRRAKQNLAAHLGTASAGGSAAAAGPLISRTVGPVSATFATPPAVQSGVLQSTKYGREYLRILETSPGLRTLGAGAAVCG